MKVLVLGGGNSPEKEVSLRSAKAVANAARKAGFDVTEADPADGLDFLDEIPKDTVVLPILHGINGEDGVIQAELEKRELPYLGSDSKVSAVCFDKWQTRQRLLAAGITMPKAILVTKQNYKSQALFNKPHVLKVVHGGSSIGTLIVRDHNMLDQEQVDGIFATEENAILEELISGFEITIPVLDQTALMPLEVVPPEGGEFDYENKYNGASQELCPPLSLTKEQIKEAQRLAEQVHKIMGCRHISRTDTIMQTDGNFVVLEINTIPGLNDQSLTPKAAAQAGLSMSDLVKKFVDLVKRDFKVE